MVIAEKQHHRDQEPWKSRAALFLPKDNGIISLLVGMILLVALGGVKLSHVVAGNMLRADARSTSAAWADTLLDNVNIPAMIVGRVPSDQEKRLLESASQVGDTYRYKVWDKSGRLVYLSERTGSVHESADIAGHPEPEVMESAHSGVVLAKAQTGSSPTSPTYYAESYIPVKQNGVVVGVIEVNLDQTTDKALYEKAFLITESIIAIAVLLAGGLPGFLVFRKMKAHRKAEAEAQFLTEHDRLTNILNRKGLEEAARRAITRAGDGIKTAALLIDLDRFKDTNENLGNAAGDEVLRAFAKRLHSLIGEDDLVGRLSSDEFLILQVNAVQPAGSEALARQLIQAFSEPLDIGGLLVNCEASIGVAIAPTDTHEGKSLFSCADAALQKAKAEGRNTVCFFEAGMDAVFHERRRLEADIRRAVETDAFQLAYQPLYSFHDGSLLGFEALLRWPEGWNTQSPAAFIPIAEESGLIVPIGVWALETACKVAASWERPLKIAINLSPVQFFQGNIVSSVQKALNLSGLDPARLELEVTESLWIQNPEVVLDRLSQFRRIGISIALDDFGTGYSSLAYLWKFPFDKVKIDRSFVAEMNIDPKAGAIIRTIVALGKTLDLAITAEGIETFVQAQALKEAGCDQAQGYFFGRPLTTELSHELVNSRSCVELPNSHVASYLK